MALSYSRKRESAVNLIAADRTCISLSYLFCRLVVSLCRFVMFSLSSCIEGKIRERRGALLFALKEELAAKVITADSSHLHFRLF